MIRQSRIKTSHGKQGPLRCLRSFHQPTHSIECHLACWFLPIRNTNLVWWQGNASFFLRSGCFLTRLRQIRLGAWARCIFFLPYTGILPGICWFVYIDLGRCTLSMQYIMYLVREAPYDDFVQSVLTLKHHHTFDSNTESAAGLFSETSPCCFLVFERSRWYSYAISTTENGGRYQEMVRSSDLVRLLPSSDPRCAELRNSVSAHICRGPRRSRHHNSSRHRFPQSRFSLGMMDQGPTSSWPALCITQYLISWDPMGHFCQRNYLLSNHHTSYMHRTGARRQKG